MAKILPVNITDEPEETKILGYTSKYKAFAKNTCIYWNTPRAVNNKLKPKNVRNLNNDNSINATIKHWKTKYKIWL